MTVRPLHDRVLAKRIEKTDEEIRGGIYIPDTAKEKPQEAVVTAVGPGKYITNGNGGDGGKRQPLDVKAGDRILIGKYSGSEIKIDGDDYMILREDDVLAVLES
jgi:chaperonin GroES